MNHQNSTQQTFIGNPASKRKKSLKNKTALVRPHPTDTGFVLAQFDDRATGLGYGWHRFPAHQFKPVEKHALAHA